MDWIKLADAIEKHPKQVMDKSDWVTLLRQLAKDEEPNGDQQPTEEE